ncbi:MAG: heavy metal-binding domain-containing protein [Methanobacterium sp. ERen5]|nr:MAG: heavy metal-binding domain-containing protein [Methanobacterium sp. ERen5]
MQIDTATPGVDEQYLDDLTIPILSIAADTSKIEKYMGMVSGESVATERESEGTLEKLTSIIEPVELGDYDMASAREMAISRMLDEAKAIGANSVIEVLVEYVSMGGLQGSSLIITATGTAVKYK